MGAKKDEVYKCDICGNTVYVAIGGDGELVCCGENMRLLEPDAAKTVMEDMPKPGSP